MPIDYSTLARAPLEPMLTNEEVLEYFTTHMSKGGCPLCLHDRFTLLRLSEDQSVYHAMPIFQLEAGKPIAPSRRHLPIVCVVCDNCGSLYSLVRTVIEAWADAKRVEQGHQS